MITIDFNTGKVHFEYDKLNRLTQVATGLSDPIQYSYQQNEPDLRIQLDDRTAPITLPQASHDLNGVAYTRANITPWPNIAWDQRLGRLLLNGEHGITVPDVVIRSANQRRRLYDAVKTGLKGQRDFDKPSSAFFLPPEYHSINCFIPECLMYDMRLANPATAIVNQTKQFYVEADWGYRCTPLYKFTVGGQSFGWGYGNSLPYTFTEAGSHSVQVVATCQCDNQAYFDPQFWDVQVVDVQCPIIPDEHIGKPGQTVNVEYIAQVRSPDPAATDSQWGEMGFIDSASLLDLTLKAYYVQSQNHWQVKITKATSSYWMWWRLLPPRPSINKPLPVKEASTSAVDRLNCTKMLADLRAAGPYDSDWYVLKAIEAHERTHGTQWQAVLNTHFQAIRTEIESLTVPNRCGMTAEQARNEIESSQAFKQIRTTNLTQALGDYGNIKETDPELIQAELQVVNPLIGALVNVAKPDWPAACKTRGY